MKSNTTENTNGTEGSKPPRPGVRTCETPADGRLAGLTADVQAAQDVAKEALQEVADLQREVEQLREELAEVREQTSLLQTVNEAAALKPDERAAVLIQTLCNEAQHNRAADRPPAAKMDWHAAKSALGGSINRRQVYSSMERAVELCERADSDALQYRKPNDRNYHLHLDLRRDDLPQMIADHAITTEEKP